MASPFFSEGTNFLLEGPGVARLLVELPVSLGDGSGAHEPVCVEVLHRLVAFAFADSIADPRRIDAGVDNEMRDVNILRAELTRGALRNGAQPEFRRGK